MSDELTTLQRLAAPFPASEVKKDPQGNHYISIDAVQNRFDEVLGMNWDLEVVHVDGPNLLPTAEVTYGRNKKPAFTGRAVVRIIVQFPGQPKLTIRSGIGADLADDPDKVMKTALANAIKKAGHQFGVGRYLWDADERTAIDNTKAAIAGNSTALKREAQKLAKKLTGKAKPTATESAKALGIKVAELTDDEALRRALTEHGVL